MAVVEAATVVITNYNYGRFVAAAVNSVLAQTVSCQIVVVDDGSIDDSLTVLERYASTNPGRVEVVAKENGGQASAFNAGWERCRAPVVFFLDGDDTLEPGAVERVLAAFDEADGSAGPATVTPASKCQFRMTWIDEAGQPIAGEFPEPDRRLPVGDLRAQMGRNPDDVSWQPTSGNAFRASVLAAILPMPEAAYRISADHYLSNLSALYGPVLAIEAPLANYRVHGANADHRAGFDLDRARDILVRTEHTHRELIAHGTSLGLAMPTDPSGFGSLTTAGLGLVSSRFPGHPLAAEGRLSLVRRTAGASLGRTDFGLVRRVGGAVWALAVGFGPRRVVKPLAARALTR